MIKPCLISLVLSFVFAFSFAQPSTIDNQSQFRMVDSLNELAFTIKKNDVVSALTYLLKAQKIANQINYTNGYAVSLLYEAGIYQQSGFSNKALVIYQKSLEISKQNNDSFNVARCNLQIANALLDNKKIDEAEVLYNQSLKTFQQLKIPKQIANVINNLAQLELTKRNYDLAIQYSNTSLSISKSSKHKYGEKKALQNLGNVYLGKLNLVQAKNLFEQAKLIDEIDKDFYGLSYSYAQLAVISLKQNEISKSLNYALQGFSAARLAQSNNLIETNINNILAVHKKNGNLIEVNRWQDSLISISKEQNKQDKQYAINFLDLIKEQELQTIEAQHNALDAEKQANIRLLIILFGAVFLVVSIVFTIITYNNFKKQKLLTNELEQKNMIIEGNNVVLDKFNKTISEHNSQLDAQIKMKDKLLSIISHDLRHPLINTKGIIELINNKLISNEEISELIKQLEDQYIKSIALLDNLLFWLRGQMQGIQIEKNKIDIKVLIQEVLAEQELNYINKKISLHHLIQESVIISADKEMLKIVFRNLISNAIKFTPSGGIISITYDNSKLFYCIAIQDSGIGINKQEIEKISAQNYYTTSGTMQEKGTGFGLMLCKDLIAQHRGNLIIESEPNKGSTFTIQLPIEN